jgi:hypothetical protein
MMPQGLKACAGRLFGAALFIIQATGGTEDIVTNETGGVFIQPGQNGIDVTVVRGFEVKLACVYLDPVLTQKPLTFWNSK